MSDASFKLFAPPGRRFLSEHIHQALGLELRLEAMGGPCRIVAAALEDDGFSMRVWARPADTSSAAGEVSLAVPSRDVRRWGKGRQFGSPFGSRRFATC